MRWYSPLLISLPPRRSVLRRKQFYFAECHGLAAVAILLEHFAGREWFAGTQWQMLAFFDEQHIAPGFGKQAGRDRPPGPLPMTMISARCSVGARHSARPLSPGGLGAPGVTHLPRL